MLVRLTRVGGSGCFAAPRLPDRVLPLMVALTLIAVAVRMIA